MAAVQNIIFLIAVAVDDSFLSVDTAVKLSDGTMQPVTSSTSNRIGPEGGKAYFQSSDVFLVVPQGAVPSATTFFLKTYLDPSIMPPVKSKNEMILSPVFHLSSSLARNHHFTKPLQVFLPPEVPLRARGSDSGWLLQLKQSVSSKGLPSIWHTVLELNTKTGVISWSSSVHYHHASCTLGLDHFSLWAWVGSWFGINSELYVDYAVFGKQQQHNIWEIAVHVIYKSKVVYKALKSRLEKEAYVALKPPNTDLVRYMGEVSVKIQCMHPWKVEMGKPDEIDAKLIWGCKQGGSCYRDVIVKAEGCTADTLQCIIEVSFKAKGDAKAGHPVRFNVFHPLQVSQVVQQTEDERSHTAPGPGEEVHLVSAARDSVGTHAG